MSGHKDAFVPNFDNVRKFIQSLDLSLRFTYAYELDPARVVSLMGFEKFVETKKIHPTQIAIVSGSLQEPELNFLNAHCQVDTLDFEQNPELFDLTKNWSGVEYEKYLEKYDLVLCEQVLEHLPNPELAFKNLSNLLAPGGYLHVSVPGINNTHGLPHYFFAGFPPQTLQYFANQTTLKTLEISGWVNDKASKMYSVCDWTPLGISSGFFQSIRFLPFWKLSFYGKAKISLKALVHSYKYPGHILFPRHSQKDIKPNYVICWGFFQKPETF